MNNCRCPKCGKETWQNTGPPFDWDGKDHNQAGCAFCGWRGEAWECVGEKIDCPHSKIQVIRQGRGYVWSCALCGNRIAFWNDLVWERMGMDPLQEGEGFAFSVVERVKGVELQA